MKVISKSKDGVKYPISLFGSKKVKGIPFWVESNYITGKDCVKLNYFKHPLQTIIYHLHIKKDDPLKDLLTRIKSVYGGKFFILRGVIDRKGNIYAFSTISDKIMYGSESRAEIIFNQIFDLGLDACPVVIGYREYKSEEELLKFANEYFKNEGGDKLIFRDIDNNHILTIKK